MGVSTAIDLSAVARDTGITTAFKNLKRGGVTYLPQRIALFGQGSTASTFSTSKAQVTSALEVAQTYGFGSPLHLAALQLLPTNGDGVGTLPVTVYPLDDEGGATAAAGDITPAGAVSMAGSFVVRVINIVSQAFSVAVGDTVAQIVTKIYTAMAATLDLPVTAVDSTTKVDVTAKWKGASGNDLYLEVVGPTDTGVTFAFTQPTGGATNPNIDAALAQIGGVWETMIVNCLDIADTTTLGKYTTAGEGRWLATVRKPFLVFTGNTEAVVATAIAVPDARKTDRVNCQLVAPGSNDLPFVVAARQVARIAVLANNNPPHDYGSQAATGLTPGLDSVQWDFTKRDQAVKGGSSTIEVRDGVVNISDVVTFYHPSGDPTPAYRFVVDVVKVMNILFNTDIIFAAAEWDGAPLIPDDQPTVNRSAKKPKTAVTAVAAMIDSLGLEAIISDPVGAKTTIQAEINSQNPKRLDVAYTVALAGNTNIKSIDFNFGFYFGTPSVTA